jgi:hypothetical protein
MINASRFLSPEGRREPLKIKIIEGGSMIIQYVSIFLCLLAAIVSIKVDHYFIGIAALAFAVINLYILLKEGV